MQKKNFLIIINLYWYVYSFCRRSISASVICGVIFYLQVFFILSFFFLLFIAGKRKIFCVKGRRFNSPINHLLLKTKKVSIRVLSTFNCVEYGGELYLEQDKQIKCFEGHHLAVKIKQKKNIAHQKK